MKWRFLFLVLPLTISLHSSGNSPKCEVRGTVTDFFGSRVAGATVRFFEGRNEERVETAADGTYSIHLPQGTYTANVKDLGFCTVSRSPFTLVGKARVQFDFELFVCPFDSSELPYGEEQLLPLRTSEIKPLVQFGCRKDRGAIEYTGFVQQGKYVRPVLTFNLATLRGNSIIYDATTNRIKAEGDVIWQDGQTSKSAKFVEITLTDPPRVVKIE